MKRFMVLFRNQTGSLNVSLKCPQKLCRKFSCMVTENKFLACSTSENGLEIQEENNNTSNAELENILNVENSMDLQAEDNSVLNRCEEDISTFAPYFRPSFNFAAYVNKSHTLQELVKLGVNLSRLEERKGVPELLLKMDFDEDMTKYIRFLHDMGVPSDELGSTITRNPFIFEQDLDNLEIRINYLHSKKFSDDMITRIIRKNPLWLNFSTEEIDKKLGYFQQTFKLQGYEVRKLASKQPRLITYKPSLVKVNTFSFKEEMGFTDDEMKCLLLEKPRLWMKCNKVLVAVFHYAHKVMKLEHKQIVDFPHILCSRLYRVKQRHQFLKLLGRAQYDPKLEGYVSPQALVSGTDSEFSQVVAKSSVEVYNMFLKTI